MEEIWLKFEKKLRTFTMSKVNDRSVTDDILQELFIRIHANIDRVKDETKLQSWIFQICRNLIIDHFRSRSRIQNGALPVAPGFENEDPESIMNGEFSVTIDPEDENRAWVNKGYSSVTPEPGDEGPGNFRKGESLFNSDPETGSDDIMAEALEDMVKMMGNLPPEYCEALCLTELGNMNQKEYADKAGISYSGAKSRVQRARKMLKDMLMQCCHYEFDKYGTVLNIYPAGCCCCHK